MGICILARRGVVSLLGIVFASSLYAGEPTQFPVEARKKYEEALEFQKQGQLKKAVDAYEDAMRLGMEAFPRAHLYRANSNLELKDFDKALAQYSKFIADFTIEESCRY